MQRLIFLMIISLPAIIMCCQNQDMRGKDGKSDDKAGIQSPAPAVVVTPDVQKLFADRGIKNPATEMTTQQGGEVDLDLIRDAIAEAKEVEPEEREQAARPMAMNAEAAVGGAPEPESDAPGSDAFESTASDEVKEEKVIMELNARALNIVEKKEMVECKDKALPTKSIEKKFDEAEQSKKPEKTVLKQVKSISREGKILVYDETGKLKPLKAHELRIITYIQGPRARTVVDYVFENTHERTLEGTFYYPLPGGATPVGFAMFEASIPVNQSELFRQGKALPELTDDTAQMKDFKVFAPVSDKGGRDWKGAQIARVVEQKRARQVYEEVVRRQVDPALLEWSGGNTFKARVFPIGGKSFKRIVLVYEQTQIFDGAFLRYTYPLPESKLAGPVQARVHIDSSEGTIVSLYMGARQNDTIPEGRQLETWKVYDLTAASGEGELSIAVKPEAARRQVLVGTDPEGLAGKTFYARILPDIPEGKQLPTGRAVFIVDTSLSCESEKRLPAPIQHA